MEEQLCRVGARCSLDGYKEQLGISAVYHQLKGYGMELSGMKNAESMTVLVKMVRDILPAGVFLVMILLGSSIGLELLCWNDTHDRKYIQENQCRKYQVQVLGTDLFSGESLKSFMKRFVIFDTEMWDNLRPLYGSFVRPHKLSLGCDEITALKDCYGDGSFDEEGNRIILHKQTKQETFIEMVGFDKIAKKQSNFEVLREVDLTGMPISRPSSVSNLGTVAPNLRELNLRNTLLSSLKDIVKIAGQLKLLEKLNISENRLHDLTSSKEQSHELFPSLTTLYANKMKLNWNEVLRVLSISSKMKELFLCYNNIEKPRVDSLLDHIVLLNMEGNRLTWDSVLNISSLKSLQRLILNDNQIEAVNLPKDAEAVFPKLKSLSLNSNKISSYNSINALDRLPSLTDLRFKDNPVSQDLTSFVARQELIARVGKLLHCNGSAINETERKTAELAYIKRYADDYFKGDQTDTLISKHPRYMQLVSVHGAPPKPVNTGGTSLKQNLLGLTFKCPDCDEKPEIHKSVPGTVTVQQVKSILQRQYRVLIGKQKLSYIDKKNNREIELDENTKQLVYYSVADGDTILLRW